MRAYYEELPANTSENLNEMDKVLKNVNLLTYPKRHRNIGVEI